MSKIYLCCQIPAFGQEDNAKKIAAHFPYFDGTVIVVNWNSPIENLNDSETFGYLRHQCQKEQFNNPAFSFEIIPNRWINFNNIPMTMFLQAGILKNCDWGVWIDSQEQIKEEFLKGLRDRIARYDEEGYTSAWWGRPYIFKFHDQMTFEGNPHCFPQPLLQGKTDDLRDESLVKYEENGVHFGNFLFNSKKFENSYVLSAFKYIWCYSISNEMRNQFGCFGEQVVDFHESRRTMFRRYCREQLGIENTIEGITQYFKEKQGAYDQTFIEYVEMETIFKDFFRLVILKQPLNTILANRNRWSFVEYLKTGNVLQKDSLYINTRNYYNQLAGKPLEA